MSSPVLLAGLSAGGSLLAGIAAWVTLASPWARNRKAARQARERREREVYEALYGIPERRDEAGALIAAAHPGLIASVVTINSRLDAPLLNGKGDDVIATVTRLDRRTVGLLRRVASIEKHLRIGAEQ